MEWDVFKLDCRDDAADSLPSEWVQSKLESLLHTLLARGRIEDFLVDLGANNLLEVLLGHSPLLDGLIGIYNSFWGE